MTGVGDQLALPLPALRPTISWARDDMSVWQCGWCGTLVAIPRARTKPGRCPTPDCEWPADKPPEWWKQRLPVGPFDSTEG